jgi:glycosyltransferase involved in cell wall biosynthesis
MNPQEERVLRLVDQVIVHSPELMERKGRINRNTISVPNGVDYQLYSTKVAEPRDIASIPHPRIGYTGHLKKQLDWPLLRDLVFKHRDWSFVFVGPSKLSGEDAAILASMRAQPNVYLLGEKTVTELAAYPQHFDVCIMPYVINGYTQNVYPMKLHEYLATGRPVVGTPIRSVLDFEHIVALGKTADDWSKALAWSLTDAATTRDRCEARQRIARDHDWSELTYRVAQSIVSRLDKPFSTPVERLHTATPNFDHFQLALS